MTEHITVTVAPHTTHRIPHPAGEAFGMLDLCGGDTFEATLEHAQRLFDRGLILHPVTGEMKPVGAAVTRFLDPRVSITTAGKTFDGSSVEWKMELARQGRDEAERARIEHNAKLDERYAKGPPRQTEPPHAWPGDSEAQVAALERNSGEFLNGR